MKKPSPRITSFDLHSGSQLGGKYEVVSRLGAGWEGEVYLVREKGTRIERTVKIFFPHRNPGNRALRFYARKLQNNFEKNRGRLIKKWFGHVLWHHFTKLLAKPLSQ